MPRGDMQTVRLVPESRFFDTVALDLHSILKHNGTV